MENYINKKRLATNVAKRFIIYGIKISINVISRNIKEQSQKVISKQYNTSPNILCDKNNL